MAKKKVILSNNDVKNSLSSMKKVKQPKTVLINNLTDYWPALNEEQVVELEEILNSFASDESNKQFLSIGIESTLRNIKNKSAKVLLIADEISPQWFGKHIIAMVLTKSPNTKILIVPKLRDFTSRLLKVPAVVMSIKTDTFDEFYSSLNIHDKLLKIYYTVKPNADVSKPKRTKNKINQECPIVYLKKTSESTPAFKLTNDEEKMEFEDSSDFISLAKYNDPELLAKKSTVPAYRPLKIKKIVGNVKRKAS